MRTEADQVVQVLQRGKSLLLYGQEDYIERIRTYVTEIMPQVNLQELAFPLQKKRPEKTIFDFHRYDTILMNLEQQQTILVVFSMSQHAAVRKTIEKFGFVNVYYYTADMENALKRRYFNSIFARDGKSYLDVYTLPAEHVARDARVHIYMTQCIVDKPLQQSVKDSAKIVIPVQAGAALTEQRIAKIVDNTGENISERNRHYSEMTVAYWAWKNSSSEYVGMSHYRRMFVDPEAIAQKLCTTAVEAVLPLPTLYLHSLEKEYFLRYIPEVWQTMLEVLDDMHPEYSESARQIFAGRYFYGNNMWVLKREVLDQFFSWMFPMLFEIEHRIGELSDSYYNRYTGFCSELFTTLYFLDNRQGWKIAYAEKIFLN